LYSRVSKKKERERNDVLRSRLRRLGADLINRKKNLDQPDIKGKKGCCERATDGGERMGHFLTKSAKRERPYYGVS